MGQYQGLSRNLPGEVPERVAALDHVVLLDPARRRRGRRTARRESAVTPSSRSAAAFRLTVPSAPAGMRRVLGAVDDDRGPGRPPVLDGLRPPGLIERVGLRLRQRRKRGEEDGDLPVGHGAAPCTDGACSRARLPAGESGKSLARRVWRRLASAGRPLRSSQAAMPLEGVGHGARGRVLGHGAGEVLARAVGVAGLHPRAGRVHQRLSGAGVRRVGVGELLEGPGAGQPRPAPGLARRPPARRPGPALRRLPATPWPRPMAPGWAWRWGPAERRTGTCRPSARRRLPAVSSRTTFRWAGTTRALSAAAMVAGTATAARRASRRPQGATARDGGWRGAAPGRPARSSRRSGSPSTRPAWPGRAFSRWRVRTSARSEETSGLDLAPPCRASGQKKESRGCGAGGDLRTNPREFSGVYPSQSRNGGNERDVPPGRPPDRVGGKREVLSSHEVHRPRVSMRRRASPALRRRSSLARQRSTREP